jgi:hypothetical protein
VRTHAPFQPADLLELEQLYERASRVVAMADVFDGDHASDVIAIRHDCDNVIAPAVQLAEWEADRGYRSTYYVLHSAPYWQDKPTLQAALEVIAGCGHEIGLHNDALTVALLTGQDPAEVIEEALADLRGYGHEIRSTVAHGHALCRVANYVNDEMWIGCHRPDYGSPVRELEHEGRRVFITPRSLSAFGLDFDANWLPRGDYLSDSGGRWSQWDDAIGAFPARGQLHVLQHPDWWPQALTRPMVAA